MASEDCAKVGAEACTPHDDTGLTRPANTDPVIKSKLPGTKRCAPNLTSLGSNTPSNNCDYWKTIATDGKAVHIGGHNSVNEHPNTIYLHGTRKDIGTCTEGDVAKLTIAVPSETRNVVGNAKLKESALEKHATNHVH